MRGNLIETKKKMIYIYLDENLHGNTRAKVVGGRVDYKIRGLCAGMELKIRGCVSQFSFERPWMRIPKRAY